MSLKFLYLYEFTSFYDMKKSHKSFTLYMKVLKKSFTICVDM